ncbi:unnamed protein product [Ambrosiozyma monospora]|uniref:Unnamed protein product n=1 Tax=Ambrosiozyma monospora TaxID=43982 RepID=A0ACB5T029_AMBMO|nr:unnamed protein product [Ambrosiozyma monospora]
MSFLQTFKNYCSYFEKYLSTWLVAVAIFTCSTYMELNTTPFQRHFSLSDPKISYPFSKVEQFNNFKLAITAVVFPFIIMVAIIFFKSLKSNHKDKSQIIHLAHITTLSYFMALSLNVIVTEFLKLRIGKLRPDFLDRCGADVPIEEIMLDPFKIYNASICTAPYGQAILMDGFKSCPSGHSSFAWTGFNFLNLFIMGQLKLYSGSNNNRGRFTLFKLINLLPLAFCLHIALSRSQDYRHDFYDITLGLRSNQI